MNPEAQTKQLNENTANQPSLTSLLIPLNRTLFQLVEKSKDHHKEEEENRQ